MTMVPMVNPNLAAAMSYHLAWMRFGGQLNANSKIYFCIGAYPSSAVIDAITGATSTTITNNLAATINGSGITLDVVSETAVPPVWTWKTLPSGKTFTSGKTGTIGWALLDLGTATSNAIVVDVGLPGSGACIILDVVDVVANTTQATIQSMSFKLWR